MRAMILAAGKGERMRPLTLVKPKPLLEVQGISLIEHHIINLKKSGFNDIVINVSWLAQQIMQKLGSGEKYGVKIRYSFEGNEPLETGGGIFNALKLIGKAPFLVVNGDIFTDIDFSTLHLKTGKLAHLMLVNNPKHNPMGDFSLSESGSLSTDNTNKKYTFSGIGIYHPYLFKNCKLEKFSVVPLLKNAMKQKHITGQLFKGKWDDIGTIDRLLAINSP